MANIVQVIFRGIDQLSNVVGGVTQSVTQLERTAVTTRNLIAGIFAADRLLAWGRQAVTAVENMQEYREVLTQVTGSLEDMERVQSKLLRTSVDTDTAYAKTLELFVRLTEQNDKLGLSENRRIQIIQTLNQAMQLAGPFAGDVAAQFNRILLTGELSGRSMIQLFTRVPRLAEALADELGVTVDKLNGLAAKGKITTSVFLNAMSNQAGKIAEDFEKTGQTIGESITNLGTSITALLTKWDEKLKLTDTYAQGIQNIANQLLDFKDKSPFEAAVDDLREQSDLLSQLQVKLDYMRRRTKEPEPGLERWFEGLLGIDDRWEQMDKESDLQRTQEEMDRAQELWNQLAARVSELKRAEEEESVVKDKNTKLTEQGTERAAAMVEALQRQAEMLGMSAKQAKLWEMHLEGASIAQQENALAIMNQIEAYNRLQENMAASADPFAVPEDGVGPVFEVEPGLDELANMSAVAWQSMGRQGREAAEEIDIAWDQAIRNIQTILAKELFEGFDDGLKGMVKSFIDAVRQMLAEALAANLVQALFGKQAPKEDGGGQFSGGLLSGFINGLMTGGFGSKGKAAGGWTTPGMLHPINEQEPEFLISGDRSRVVPLSKAAANGIGGGGSTVLAPSNTYHISTTLSPFELEALLRSNEERTIARFMELNRDGVLA